MGERGCFLQAVLPGAERLWEELQDLRDEHDDAIEARLHRRAGELRVSIDSREAKLRLEVNRGTVASGPAVSTDQVRPVAFGPSSPLASPRLRLLLLGSSSPRLVSSSPRRGALRRVGMATCTLA